MQDLSFFLGRAEKGRATHWTGIVIFEPFLEAFKAHYVTACQLNCDLGILRYVNQIFADMACWIGQVLFSDNGL